MIKLSIVREEIKGLSELSLKRKVDAAIKEFEKNTFRLWRYREDHILNLYFDPMERRGELFVPLYPIELIEITTWSQEEPEKATIESTDYTIISDRGKIVRIDGNYFQDYIEVKLTGGYEEDDFESEFPDVIEAIILQLQFTIQRNSKMNLHLSSQAFEKGSTSFLSPVYHPKFKEICELYKRHA